MIKPTSKNTCELVMSGGEFCGNACRAATIFMYQKYGSKKSQITINGIKVSGFCDNVKSEISLKRKDIIVSVKKGVLNGGFYTLVIQKQMTQVVIVEDSKLYKSEPTTNYAQQIKEQLGLDDKAVGVIFLSKNNEMKPFVWVKDIDTFYEETACGSGSISSALAIQKSQNKKYYITQPSGVVFEIKLSKNTIVISGEWKQ